MRGGFVVRVCDNFLRREIPKKATSRLLSFSTNYKSSLFSTSTVYPYSAHPSQKLYQFDNRISEIGFSNQSSSAPSVLKKSTSQTRFFHESILGTGDSETLSTQTQSSSAPSVLKKPTSQTRFFHESILGTGDSETLSTQTRFFEKPISETGLSEEPTSETGIPDKPISKTGFLEDTPSDIEFCGNPNSENRFPDEPTSQNSEEITSCSANSDLTQDSVIELLLRNRHDPNTALKFFRWAEGRRGFVRGVDALCIMLHILARSRRISSAQKLLKQSFSGNSIPSASVLIERLIESSKRCDSHPCLFDYVINCYVQAGRIEEAAESFYKMVENNIFPGITSRNILLAALVRVNLTGMARKLYQEMQYKGMGCDCFTLDVVMNACLKEGNPYEAEEHFREMKSRGFELDSVTYGTLIRAVCEKPDSKKACELLEEMKGMGWIPSEVTYASVIEACMKKGNLQEALRLKDEAISNGRTLNFGGSTSN